MYIGTHAAATPAKAAAVMSGTGEELSYARLEERSTRLARALHDAGLRPGDHIALLSENNLTYFEVYWAALRSGLYITVVNHHLTAAECAYIVDDCDARVLIASAGVAELAAQVAGLSPKATLRLAFGGQVPGFGDYDAALAAASPEPLPHQPLGADMLYSSGTTGRPKGIKGELPAGTVEDGEPHTPWFQPLYGFGTDTVYLGPAPLYHAAPLRFAGVIQTVGGTVVVMERFDAEAALAAIERYQVTHSQWVPTMFVRMLKLPEKVRERYDLSSLKVAIHAAAPCPVDVKRRMIEWWGPVLHEYYAATEGHGLTVIGTQEWLERPGSVGRAATGIVRICDDEGTVLPPGQVGTVYFERTQDGSPFEYHKDPEKTAGSRHPHHAHWATTGDIGYLDEDGYLFLTDRKAFMIISGGVNIYPREIEDCLTLHEAVLDVAVIGIPDEEMGESVKAVVQLAPGVEPGPAVERELIEYVRARLAHYKAPRSVDFVDRLPRTPTGKLVKRLLRERYASAV